MEPAKTDRDTFKIVKMQDADRTSSKKIANPRPDTERDEHTWRCVRPNKVRCANA